jgi:hypothetical protein
MCTLRVYVARHCPASRFSVDLARQAAKTFPQVTVLVIDVDDAQWGSEEERQAVLFTPGYFLNGRPIFWGNPPLEDLFGRLNKAVGASAPGDRG